MKEIVQSSNIGLAIGFCSGDKTSSRQLLEHKF